MINNVGQLYFIMLSEEKFKDLCNDSFNSLFSKAKAKNETQFLTSFFAFHNFSNHNILSYIADFEFSEVLDFINNFRIPEEIKEVDHKNKTRIKLILYVHIIEVDLIYMIIINMIRTILSQKYSAHFYRKTKKGKNEILEYPKDKINQIIILSKKININFKDLYNDYYFPFLRNAFSHSQYYLSPEGDVEISRFLSPTTSKTYQKPTYKTFFTYNEVDIIFKKSLIYLESFINNYKKYNDPYMDGKSYQSLFGPIFYDKKYGWGFERRIIHLR